MARLQKTIVYLEEEQGGSHQSAAEHLESELVAIFSDLAQLLGNPRSCGAIYGALFASERALSMDEIIARLGISKGSASQGLRQLTNIGAVKRAKNGGERPARYQAELELRRLLTGFLHEQLTPKIESTAARLGNLGKMIPDLPGDRRSTTSERLAKLSTWHRRASALMPMVIQLLQDD